MEVLAAKKKQSALLSPRPAKLKTGNFSDFSKSKTHADGTSVTQEDIMKLEQRIYSYINEEMQNLKDVLLGGPIPDSMDSGQGVTFGESSGIPRRTTTSGIEQHGETLLMDNERVAFCLAL
jgi:hypothetical protein